MTSVIVLLGPPGVGKGTQADILSTKIHLAHVSSGDLFRENIKNRTGLGKKAEEYIKKGDLVPDDLTIAMVEDRLKQPDCSSGVILDGFPRTPAQAGALHTMLAAVGTHVSVVPFISAPSEVLVERVGGRWVCQQQGHLFHQRFSPPKTAGVCDIDGSRLFQREDDKPETIARRIRVYLEQTAPLVEFYRAQGILVEIDGTQTIEEVTEALVAAIGNHS